MIRRLILVLLLLCICAPAQAGWLAQATFRPSAGTNLFGNPRGVLVRGHRTSRPAKGYYHWSR